MITPHTKSAAARMRVWRKPVPDNEPIVQNVMDLICSCEKEMMRLITLEANMEKMTPMRMMLWVLSDRSST